MKGLTDSELLKAYTTATKSKLVWQVDRERYLKHARIVEKALAEKNKGEVAGHVSRDSSIAHMIVNLPEGTPVFTTPQPELTESLKGRIEDLEYKVDYWTRMHNEVKTELIRMECKTDRTAELEAECYRLKLGINQWLDKTNWVQKRTKWPFPVLNMHLADVMTKHIEELESEVVRLREVLEVTEKTINRQLEMISARAPGAHLNKSSIVQSLKRHIQRIKAALATEKVNHS